MNQYSVIMVFVLMTVGFVFRRRLKMANMVDMLARLNGSTFYHGETKDGWYVFAFALVLCAPSLRLLTPSLFFAAPKDTASTCLRTERCTKVDSTRACKWHKRKTHGWRSSLTKR
jgi:hypothetical protein